MTLNEKRIFIREVENPCADCENKGCNVCNCGEIWKAAIPRAEAVERMAGAIAKDQWKRLATQNDTFEAFFKRHKVAFDNSAEAALNALLGGKNG